MQRRGKRCNWTSLRRANAVAGASDDVGKRMSRKRKGKGPEHKSVGDEVERARRDARDS